MKGTDRVCVLRNGDDDVTSGGGARPVARRLAAAARPCGPLHSQLGLPRPRARHSAPSVTLNKPVIKQKVVETAFTIQDIVCDVTLPSMTTTHETMTLYIVIVIFN